ncbi:MAG: hypothetical protein ACWGMZ_07790, partial [Thermoguttaceae bacterium]
EQFKADPATLEKLREDFYFQPNPSIREVISIGTPFHGSNFSSQTTQWLMNKLITLPDALLNIPHNLFLENQGAFVPGSLAEVKTSIDSLSPSSPIFPVLLRSPHLPGVKYHNIIGVVPSQWWLSAIAKQSDGVVSKQSAHLDEAVSEIVVPADHTTVQTNPAAILEVRRILLEHLSELGERPIAPLAAVQRLPRL